MEAVDLFAGCGGLSLGLMKAGINVVAAYENWNSALEVYRNNIANHPIFDFDLSKEAEAIEHIKQFKPDIIVGGPPCQDFSSAGKRNELGSRADLTYSFCNIVKGVRPLWFVMENVDRIEKSSILKNVKQEFRDAGYGLTSIVLDASQCNVPQKRKRFILFGRLNESDDFILKNTLKELSTERLTLKEYFNGSLDTEFYYRHPRSYSRRGVFSINEPSPTIRGVNRPIPPNYPFHPADASKDSSRIRPLTTLERARIQTFPADFNWTGTKSVIEQLIGNAVPVNLAEFIGKRILDFENKRENLSAVEASSLQSEQIRLFKEENTTKYRKGNVFA